MHFLVIIQLVQTLSPFLRNYVTEWTHLSLWPFLFFPISFFHSISSPLPRFLSHLCLWDNIFIKFQTLHVGCWPGISSAAATSYLPPRVIFHFYCHENHLFLEHSLLSLLQMSLKMTIVCELHTFLFPGEGWPDEKF